MVQIFTISTLTYYMRIGGGGARGLNKLRGVNNSYINSGQFLYNNWDLPPGRWWKAGECSWIGWEETKAETGIDTRQ